MPWGHRAMAARFGFLSSESQTVQCWRPGSEPVKALWEKSNDLNFRDEKEIPDIPTALTQFSMVFFVFSESSGLYGDLYGYGAAANQSGKKRKACQHVGTQ